MDGITRRGEKEPRPVEVTDDELRGFIDRAGVVDQTGAESLIVIMRHLLNEAYRAGREDEARELGITCQDDPGALWPPADHFHECAHERDHRSRTHRCQCGMEWQLVDQSGDGVQPTEEQRAREEDQKRGEEAEHG